MNVRISLSLLAGLIAGSLLSAQEADPAPVDLVPIQPGPATLPGPTEPAFSTPANPAPMPSLPGNARPSPEFKGGNAFPGTSWESRPVSQSIGLMPQVNPHAGYWVSAEYVMAFQHAMRLPPLVTTSPAGTAQNVAGVLGQDTTTVLSRQSGVNDGLRNGLHVDLGYWLPSTNNRVAVQTGFKFIASNSYNFSAASDGTTILARPFLNFTDANNNKQDASLIAFPGVSTGSIRINSNLDSFYDFNVDLRENFYADGNWRWDSLIGYRFLRQQERLNITQVVSPLGAAFIPGTTITSIDQFEASNDFHGLEIGLMGEWRRPRWTMEILAKVAAGQLQRRFTVAGSTKTVVPGGATTDAAGGLLALTSNIGDLALNEFTAVPEVGLTAKFDLSSNAYIRIGYNFLYIPNYARAAEQIDLAINPNLIPPGTPGSTPARPGFTFQRNELWINAFHLGFTMHY